MPKGFASTRRCSSSARRCRWWSWCAPEQRTMRPARSGRAPHTMRYSSSPPMPGITKSVMTRSNVASDAVSSEMAADASAVVTSISRPSTRPSARRSAGSSSTSSTRGRAGGVELMRGGAGVRAARALGRRSRTVVPAPTTDSISIVPPCARATSAAIGKPRPVASPAGLVEKPGSNTRASSSAGMPHPSSCTSTSTPPPCSTARTVMRPRPSVASACVALSMRLSSACASCPDQPLTSSSESGS